LSTHLHPEEQRLIAQATQGHAGAQRDLYLRYVDAMYHTVIRMAPSATDAEDILQDAFIKVFQKLDQFKGESTLGAWIKRIVINTTLNFMRSRKRIGYLHPEMAETLPQPMETETAEIDLRRVHTAIKTLPEGCRLVFNLYLLEGYQHQEIAQILGISESTSKSQYQRARRLLQQQLKGVATG
jgi:RNA polymerase sigma-70 factor (ECF subfamily)